MSGRNPYDTAYCSKHDVYFNYECEECLAEHEDFACDIVREDAWEKEADKKE